MLEHADKMLASKETDKVKVKVDIRRTFLLSLLSDDMTCASAPRGWQIKA